MPKVTNRRINKARILLARATNGPTMDLTFFFHDAMTPQLRKLIEAHYKQSYRMWSETWIIPQIKELLPELNK